MSKQKKSNVIPLTRNDEMEARYTQMRFDGWFNAFTKRM